MLDKLPTRRAHLQAKDLVNAQRMLQTKRLRKPATYVPNIGIIKTSEPSKISREFYHN